MAQSRGDSVAAEALFRSAKDAAKAGDYATACPQFAESAKLDRAPGTLLNLADCEEHLGQYANAWAHFLEAKDGFSREDTRVGYAQKRSESAWKRASKLTLKLAPGAPSVQVWRDDVLVGTAALGRPLPVDPGEHTVRVRSSDGSEQRQTIRLAPGESMDLVLSPPSRSETSAPPPPPKAVSAPLPVGSSRRAEIETPKSPTDTRTAGFVVGGIGLASLIVGATAGVMALDRASTYENHCDATGCDREGMDAASSGKTMATVSTVGIIAGVLGAGAGAYLVLRSGGTSTRVGLLPREGGGLMHIGREF